MEDAPVPSNVAPDETIPPDGMWRRRLSLTGDRLIHEAASQLIRIGRDMPKLREAGYWLYGTATRYLPRGNEVANLGEVGEKVYRGAQPSMRAFRSLKELGVDTVVNLRPECDYEGRFVEQLGMRYVYLPLPPLDAPTHAVTLDFLSVATDPDHGTVFFHCFHGADRTGTMAACLRIARDGWTVEQAIAEMRLFKVHERAQRVKVDYLHDFSRFWAELPESKRCEVLHRPLPEAPSEPEPAAPAGLVARARAWVGAQWSRWRRS